MGQDRMDGWNARLAVCGVKDGAILRTAQK
jgi:hypothetical protein